MGTYRSATILQKEDCTEHLLQTKLRAFRSNPQYVVENLYVFHWESDMLIKTKSGYWYEIECKISFSDFKHDFTKEEKHTILQRGENFNSIKKMVYHMEGSTKVGQWQECGSWKPTKRPNYFAYCVPWYLKEKVEPLIPEYAGLIILKQNGALQEIKKPPLLHKDKYKDEQLNICEKFYYRWRSCKEQLENDSRLTTINYLKNEIDFLKAEYKAATGYDIKAYGTIKYEDFYKKESNTESTELKEGSESFESSVFEKTKTKT